MQTWFLLIGALLVAMAFNSRLVQRLPLSPAMLYLGVGYAIGPGGTGLLNVDILRDASTIELAAEIAVLVTLFAVGLRLQTPRQSWRTAVRLASLGMVLTIGAAAAAAHFLLGLPALMAFLLAAILAPTDPVLASDVQIREPGERDAVRLSLTAEGGLNDGAAFPAVLLALGLLGVHSIGPWGARWIAVDLVWAVAGGLGIGWACGRVVARLLVRLRRAGQPLEFEEFLVLGTIALTYGLALTLHTYGFLAVFAAGIAVAHGIRGVRDLADHNKAPTSLSDRLLVWSGQGERLVEVALVILLGALAGAVTWSWPVVAFAVVLMLIARPLAVYITVRGADAPREQRRLIAWFGIRGIGSLYYLAFVIGKGVESSYAETIANAAVAAIVLSIFVHGISATPLMQRHEEHVTRGDSS